MVVEETTKLNVDLEKKISKKLPVFYNPVMKLNRDVTILLLNSIPDKNMQIALPLAGSGIRGIRFLKELNQDKIKNISFNDFKSEKISENLKLNNVKDNRISIYEKDANLFLLESKGFDYIDIDPFGSPNFLLNSAIQRLSRNSILAVTATDTAALSGSSKKAGIRKYYAKPMKNELMHELGIRILIRKVQLIGGENDKALIPIFCYSKDHYYRIFFRCSKGKQKVDELLKNHKFFLYNEKTMQREVSEINFRKDYDYTGPLWTGSLWDIDLVEKMFKNCDKENKKLFSLTSLINEESKIDVVGFYDLHRLAKITKKPIPKVEDVLKKTISRTHFLGWGIRSALPINELF